MAQIRAECPERAPPSQFGDSDFTSRVKNDSLSSELQESNYLSIDTELLTTMSSKKRIQIKLVQNDKPAPTAALGTTPMQGPAAAVGTMQNLQQVAPMPTPNLLDIVEQRTWENSRLRQELAYQQRKNKSCMYLLEEVKHAADALQQAVLNFQILNKANECDGNNPPVPPKQ
jgi:hypothetical protein